MKKQKEEIKMNNSHPYCSNKNCHIPPPETLYRLKQKGKKKGTWKELANAYEVSERTIRRHARQSVKEREKVKQKRGRKRKIFGNALNLLLSLTSYRSSHNTLTQKEMAEFLLKQISLWVSQQTISQTLKREGQTWKKITPRYQEQKFSQVKRFRLSTWSLPLTQFSALDECSFHLNETPRYGYAPKGKRAISLRPGNKGSNITVIICIQRKEERWVIYHEIIVGSVNTQIFNDFLNKLNSSTQRSHLLLDNVSFHHANKKRKELGLPTVGEQLEEKNMIADYLPTHTPQINPAELIINTVRHDIEKSRSWTFKEFKNAIDKEMVKLNNKDLTPYFQSALTYFDNEIIGSMITFYFYEGVGKISLWS